MSLRSGLKPQGRGGGEEEVSGAGEGAQVQLDDLGVDRLVEVEDRDRVLETWGSLLLSYSQPRPPELYLDYFDATADTLGQAAPALDTDDCRQNLGSTLYAIEAGGMPTSRDPTHSLRAIAADLNERRIPSATGRQWYASSVRNVLFSCTRT